MLYVYLYFLEKTQVIPTNVHTPLQAAACIYFPPFFNVVYNQEQLILKTIHVVHREILEKKSAVYNQERVLIERVQYVEGDSQNLRLG